MTRKYRISKTSESVLLSFCPTKIKITLRGDKMWTVTGPQFRNEKTGELTYIECESLEAAKSIVNMVDEAEKEYQLALKEHEAINELYDAWCDYDGYYDDGVMI